MFVSVLALLSSTASAGVPEVNVGPIFSVDPGQVFDLVFFVDCHADVGNYTVIVTLHPRFEFAPAGSDMNVTGDVAEITYIGYDLDSLRFEFPMMAKNDTPEGDYNIPYAVFWNSSETGYMPSQATSTNVEISVGEGASGSCTTLSFTILPTLAVISSFTIVRKRKR